MGSPFQDNSGKSSDHPARPLLLLFVDGELSSKDASQLESHLEACWPCRAKVKKIQDAIADIIEFDEQALAPQTTPPKAWSYFERQLNQLAASSGKQSIASRLLSSLHRLFALTRFSVVPRTRAAVAFGLIVLTAAAVVVMFFKGPPMVSAKELLANSIKAEVAQLRATKDPVVHQRLQLQRKTPSREETINWEVWNDTKNSRIRQILADTNATRDAAINELVQVLGANRMDPTRPLSAASYQSWHDKLRDPRDEVSTIKLSDGSDALMLRTIPIDVAIPGRISEATFVVRARDWRPVEIGLHVAIENGTVVYVLRETVSEIVALSEIETSIFFNEVVSTSTVPKRASSQASPAVPIAAPVVTPTAVASADLEVEALLLLNRAKADLGEQIVVKRTSDGTLEITGLVDTDQRKNEIANILAPLKSEPNVHIDIQSVREAVAKDASTKSASSVSVQPIEISSNTIAAEPQLRAYFSGKRLDIDDSIRDYASRMVLLSSRAMDHLWAMKRLLTQFSPEDLKALTADGRGKWVGLIREHARNYRLTLQSLRSELQPVFFATHVVGAIPKGPEITDTQELARVVNELFEVGSSQDRVIRSAFTSSNATALSTSLITSPFWQSMSETESLASRIAQ